MLEILTLLLALVLAYIWTAFPALQPYSLQLTAGLFLLYFLSKRLRGTRWHHILPAPATWETALLIAAVAVLVGGTGGVHSPFLALFYLLLFASALTLSVPTNIVQMVGLVVFLWAVSPHPFTRDMVIRLLELPVLLPLLLFARLQFEEAQKEKTRATRDEAVLQKQESEMLLFLSTRLGPKLRDLEESLRKSESNRQAVAEELRTLEQEINHLGRSIDEESNELPAKDSQK